MKIKSYLLIIAIVITAIYSCRTDDGLDSGIPERDRGEQQIVDNDSLQEYFSVYYYNKDEIAMLVNPGINDIIIERFDAGETVPDGYARLLEEVTSYTVDLFDVIYEYYVLEINTGGGEESPEFPDNVRVVYSGNTLDGEVFDSAVNPVDFDLLNLVPGWGQVMPRFNVAASFVTNGDGTITYNDPGLGVMFLPSGLGFFSASAPGVPLYSNISFKFELYQYSQNDHDGDLVPSIMENLDGDTIFTEDDDTDGDTVFNFSDTDDDNDGILTILEHKFNEYVIAAGADDPEFCANEFEVNRSEEDEDGMITINTVIFIDSDNNGIYDYLEDNIAVDNSEADVEPEDCQS